MKNAEHQRPVLDLVPLAEAVLCMDCDRISQQRSGHRCAGCESPNLINLAAVLNRSPKRETLPSRPSGATRWNCRPESAFAEATLS